jgi:hypothetical protein
MPGRPLASSQYTDLAPGVQDNPRAQQNSDFNPLIKCFARTWLTNQHRRASRL